MRLTNVEQVKVLIVRRRDLGRPIVVGVSGYAGSGKSTLVRAIVVPESAMVRLRGDDFLDPSRSHHRSSDWNGVDRRRLVDDVLIPFREERKGAFRRFDWARRELGELEPVPTGDVLLVDLIGLFHPEVLPVLDLTIWVDVPLEVARERGMRRDEELGRDHSQLWCDVWAPNEIEFDRNYSPRESAEILHPACSGRVIGMLDNTASRRTWDGGSASGPM